MRKMVPTIRVGVPRPISDRKGSRIGVVHPPIGEPFDFHDDEIEELNKAFAGAVRRPINEGGLPTSDQSGLGPEEPLAEGSGQDTSTESGKAKKAKAAEDDDL